MLLAETEYTRIRELVKQGGKEAREKIQRVLEANSSDSLTHDFTILTLFPKLEVYKPPFFCCFSELASQLELIALMRRLRVFQVHIVGGAEPDELLRVVSNFIDSYCKSRTLGSPRGRKNLEGVKIRFWNRQFTLQIFGRDVYIQGLPRFFGSDAPLWRTLKEKESLQELWYNINLKCTPPFIPFDIDCLHLPLDISSFACDFGDKLMLIDGVLRCLESDANVLALRFHLSNSGRLPLNNKIATAFYEVFSAVSEHNRDMRVYKWKELLFPLVVETQHLHTLPHRFPNITHFHLLAKDARHLNDMIEVCTALQSLHFTFYSTPGSQLKIPCWIIEAIPPAISF